MPQLASGDSLGSSCFLISNRGRYVCLWVVATWPMSDTPTRIFKAQSRGPRAFKLGHERACAEADGLSPVRVTVTVGQGHIIYSVSSMMCGPGVWGPDRVYTRRRARRAGASTRGREGPPGSALASDVARLPSVIDAACHTTQYPLSEVARPPLGSVGSGHLT